MILFIILQCTSCCMTFESRKSFFLHRRKIHSSKPIIKSETSSTSTTSEAEIKGEPLKTGVEAGNLVPKTEQVNWTSFLCTIVKICKILCTHSSFNLIFELFSLPTCYPIQMESTHVTDAIEHSKIKSYCFDTKPVMMKKSLLNV